MSKDPARAKILYQTLRGQGFLRDRNDINSYRYVGQLVAAKRTISVAITFQNLEFTRLPELALQDPENEAPHVVAHLGATGGLCFGRNEDLVLDRYDVRGTVLMCLEMARRGLERALTHKHLEQEIAQEFPQHWLGERIYYDIAAAKHERANLYRVRQEGGSERLLLSDRETVPQRLILSDANRESTISRPLPAFVFNSKSDLTFCKDFRQPTLLAEFMAWLDSTIPKASDKAYKELTGQFPEHLYCGLFVAAPNGCVGIMLDEKKPHRKAAQRRQALDRIVRDRAEKLRVNRYSGTRIDMSFILSRNMNRQETLAGRRFALIGCGTIGSHLAKFMVQSGAGHEGGTLLLVDNQVLEPGNVGRHYLGTPYIGINKCDGLKQQLTREYPDVNIMTFATDAVQIFGTLAVYDLAVDATGEEALSGSINEHFMQQRRRVGAPDVLHVWLFGNGAAAQALLVDGDGYACFKCLKPELDGNWRFSPVKANAKASLVPATCGEAQFVAYGVAAPAMAAALALRLIMDWNKGDSSPRLRTVRVERKDTIEVAEKNPGRSMRCPACGRPNS